MRTARARTPALLGVGLVAAIAVVGCVGPYKSDFSVLVVNRAANTIQVLANGNDIGQVAAGQTGSFTIRVPETNANGFANGVAPTSQAQVVISAKDLTTGISTTKSTTLSATSPTYVTFSAADFVIAVPTAASFAFSPPAPGLNQPVNFNASASTPTSGIFTWNFGDGVSAAGVSVTHQYSREGTFTAMLTVTSDAGQSSTASKTITVSATSPQVVASFTASPTNPGINQEIFFNAWASTPGSGTFAWTFGDGSIAAGVAPTHQYSRSGAYSVTLTVTNDVGQSATTTRTIAVSTTSPLVLASFTFSPINPGVDEDVFFNAAASIPSTGTFFWTLGDGSTAFGLAPSHRYAQGGLYIVTLTVTNDVGQSSTTSRTIAVRSDPYGDVIGTCRSKREASLVACVNGFIHGHDEKSDFEVVKRVAWILKLEGEDGGLLVKPGGENIWSWQGFSFSTSRVCAPLSAVWKIFADAGPGGANAPIWTDNGPTSETGSFCVSAIDPSVP